jgi:hypothetical protein
MDLAAAARSQQGLVLSSQLGNNPGRSAARRRLVPVQPRVYIAETQPVGPLEQVAAVRESVQSTYAFLGETALWLYKLAEPPDVVQAGVPHGTRFRARPPAHIRRVSPGVLRGRRPLSSGYTVALEMAIIQAAATRSPEGLLAILENVLRERRTAMPRVRSRLRRGVAGSAAVRTALDTLAGTSLDAAVRRLREALEALGITGLEPELHFRSSTGASAYGISSTSAAGRWWRSTAT